MKQKKFLTLLLLGSILILSVLFLLTVLQSKKGVSVFVQNTTSTVINSQSDTVTSSRRITTRGDLTEINAMFPDSCSAPGFLSFREPETSWASYVNREKGIQMQIPYNPAWGSPVFMVNPFDVYETSVLFGPIVGGVEGCGGWSKGYRLTFLDPETPEQLIARIEQEHGKVDASPKFMQITNTTTSNGLDVLEYTLDGMCGGGELIVFGKKANYSFSTGCSAMRRNDIISTITLIE